MIRSDYDGIYATARTARTAAGAVNAASAIHPSKTGCNSVCRRPRRYFGLFVSKHLYLAPEREQLLVFPYLCRPHIGFGIPVDREILGLYGSQLTIHRVLYLFLSGFIPNRKRIRIRFSGRPPVEGGPFFRLNSGYPDRIHGSSCRRAASAGGGSVPGRL